MAVTAEANEAMKKLQGMIEAAMQAATAEMVNEIAAKVVSMIELADDVIQPETVDLLRTLPDVSESLVETLTELKKIEEDGTLKTLIQFSQLLASVKQFMTVPMVTDLVENTVRLVEIADELAQNGALELVAGMVAAFDKAKQEREGKEPLSSFQITRSLKNPEIREGLSLLLSFAKHLPDELKTTEDR